MSLTLGILGLHPFDIFAILFISCLSYVYMAIAGSESGGLHELLVFKQTGDTDEWERDDGLTGEGTERV